MRSRDRLIFSDFSIPDSFFDGESKNFLESMGIKFESNKSLRTSESTDGEYNGEYTQSCGSPQCVMKCEC